MLQPGVLRAPLCPLTPQVNASRKSRPVRPSPPHRTITNETSRNFPRGVWRISARSKIRAGSEDIFAAYGWESGTASRVSLRAPIPETVSRESDQDKPGRKDGMSSNYPRNTPARSPYTALQKTPPTVSIGISPENRP